MDVYELGDRFLRYRQGARSKISQIWLRADLLPQHDMVGQLHIAPYLWGCRHPNLNKSKLSGQKAVRELCSKIRELGLSGISF